MIFGVGTGLGVSFMARPSEEDQYVVYPTEAGSIKPSLYNKQDREFYKYE